MTRIIRMTLTITMTFALVASFARDARAWPSNGSYIDNLGCDNIANTNLTHELGTTPPFPINESIVVSATAIPASLGVACVGDDGVPNDWHIRMTNASGNSWQDLFFVADLPFTVGNADGSAQDNTTPGFTDAFRIDGTVTFGVNNNLFSESINTNEIFEPGEIWDFILMNFTGGTPMFDSIGFSASSAGAGPSTASILANPYVPEPTSLVLLCGGAVLMMRRRNKTNPVT